MSGLRCRPGDLAVVVLVSKDLTWMLGRILRVVEQAPAGVSKKPAWTIAEIVIGPDGVRYGYVEDTCLRPIRPDTDEPATETEREKEAA